MCGLKDKQSSTAQTWVRLGFIYHSAAGHPFSPCVKNAQCFHDNFNSETVSTEARNGYLEVQSGISHLPTDSNDCNKYWKSQLKLIDKYTCSQGCLR